MRGFLDRATMFHGIIGFAITSSRVAVRDLLYQSIYRAEYNSFSSDIQMLAADVL